MKNKYNINSYSDLEREELRVRKRLKKSEAEIQTRFKQLPEAIITTGITKLVTGIINGSFFHSATSIFQSLKAYFFNKKTQNTSEDESSSGKNLKTILADALQTIISKAFNK